MDTSILDWHAYVAPGKSVTLKHLNVNLQIFLSKDAEVHLKADTSGTGLGNANLLALVENDGGVTVCSTMQVASTSKSVCSDINTSGAPTRMQLSLPSNVGLTVVDGNGDIAGTALQSQVSISLVRGNIQISTNDAVTKAQTGRGSITVSMGKLWSGLLNLTTPEGDIRLTLPRGTSFQPSGKGSALISGHGPVQMSGMAVSNQENGKLPPELRISTLHGSVTISTAD